MTVMNECFIMFFQYFMICLSDFVPDSNTRYLVGYGFILTVGLAIVTNLFILLIDEI